jgi:hypothetical protein
MERREESVFCEARVLEEETRGSFGVRSGDLGDARPQRILDEARFGVDTEF